MPLIPDLGKVAGDLELHTLVERDLGRTFLSGSGGAIIAWWLRLGLPESPRWLAQRGRHEQADEVARMIEGRVEAETGRPLPPPETLSGEIEDSASPL
jgi:hypothetical protein